MDSKTKRKIRQGRIAVADELTTATGGKIRVRHHGGHNYIAVVDQAEIPQVHYLSDEVNRTLAKQIADFCVEQAITFAAMAKALDRDVVVFGGKPSKKAA